jgi:hypothetical protein
LFIIASATQKGLSRQVRYHKVENQILRSKLSAGVPVTEREKKRLHPVLGAKRGRALGENVSILHPVTLQRWIAEAPSSQSGIMPGKHCLPTDGRAVRGSHVDTTDDCASSAFRFRTSFDNCKMRHRATPETKGLTAC